MGETIEERAEIAFELQRIDADSIPCNFLVAVKGHLLKDKRVNSSRMFKSTGNDAFCKPNKKKFVFQEDVKSIYVLYSQSVYLQQTLFLSGTT